MSEGNTPPTGGSRPTHDVVVRDKNNTKRRTNVGVAWMNEEGWLSISLGPGVVLDSRDQLYIGVYPKRRNPSPRTEQLALLQEEEAPYTDEELELLSMGHSED